MVWVGLAVSHVAAQDPSVTLTVDDIVRVENGFRVTGTVGCSGPESGGGASHDYSVTVVAEIMEGDDARYPALAEYLIIRQPPGAETGLVPGSGAGGTMTIAERDGFHITTVRLGGLRGLGEADFEGVIPAEHAGKPYRIRAALDYQFNHVNAAWPSIRYYHAEGPSGNLPPATPVHITEPDRPEELDDPRDNTDAGDFTWSSDTGTDTPPYSLPDTPGLDAPQGPEIGDATDNVMSGEVASVGIEPDGPTDSERIGAILANVQSQLHNPNLSPEQRAELLDTFNAAVQALGEMEANNVWEDYRNDSVLKVMDAALTYNPYTGLYWTSAKVGALVGTGEWGGAALNAATMIPAVNLPKAGLTHVGQTVQVWSDYYNTASAFYNDTPAWTPTGGGYSNFNTYASPGGTYANMGTSDLPHAQRPDIIFGDNR